MGSNPPGSRDLSAEPVPSGVPESKRRRRAPNTLKSDAVPSAADTDFNASQPDWWKPQPHATLDVSEFQDRPAAPLASALSCALCRGLLKEAMSCPECGHTYCYDCIEARVDIGGNHNLCPIPGCGVVLGPNPFDHHRILYDSLLDSLVQKIFPRPELDAALTARRAQREEATRQARAAVNCPGGGGSTTAHGHGRVANPHRVSSPVAGTRTGRANNAVGGCGAGSGDTDSGQDGDEESEGGSDGDRRRTPAGRRGGLRRRL